MKETTLTCAHAEVQSVSHTLPHFSLTIKPVLIYTDTSVQGNLPSRGSQVKRRCEGQQQWEWVEEVKGVMIYSSLERWETFISRNKKKPVALCELLLLLLETSRSEDAQTLNTERNSDWSL